jgi:hypothetical protein
LLAGLLRLGTGGLGLFPPGLQLGSNACTDCSACRACLVARLTLAKFNGMATSP